MSWLRIHARIVDRKQEPGVPIEGRYDMVRDEESCLSGSPVSPGIARGRICRYALPVAEPSLTESLQEEERSRQRSLLRLALAAAIERLERLGAQTVERIGEHDAAIFQAHALMLQDEELHEMLLAAIDVRNMTAARAVSAVFAELAEVFRGSETELLRERAWDLLELERLLQGYLGRSAPTLSCGDATCAPGTCRLGNAHVIVAPELTPALIMELGELTTGIITERGGAMCHGAILARSLRIPVVSGIVDATSCIPLGATILVNGNNGEVIINPSLETRGAAPPPCAVRNRRPIFSPVDPRMQILANIDTAAEADDAIAANAEGIGLYRTEMEVINTGRLLSESEQELLYLRVLRAMKGRPLYVRLFDFGADKSPPFLDLPSGADSSLGCRGARLLLTRPGILYAQARALAKASRYGPIFVTYPMITDLAQFLELKQVMIDAIADIDSHDLHHGIMFEVPSACLQAPELLCAAEFGSLGTNDLTQFLFAADRQLPGADTARMAAHPVLWSVVRRVAEAARAAGRPLTLCGELAGDPAYLPRLLNAGVTRVSVPALKIAALRGALHEIPEPEPDLGPSLIPDFEI